MASRKVLVTGGAGFIGSHIADAYVANRDRLWVLKPLTIFGDGLQTRDYVFVKDVVTANMLLSDVVLPATTEMDQRAFNVGTGLETSVVELANTMARAAGRTAEIIHEEARPGEVMRSALDAGKLRDAGWQPAYSLEDALRITYDYIRDGE